MNNDNIRDIPGHIDVVPSSEGDVEVEVYEGAFDYVDANLKTSGEWEVELGVRVMDPDGWDRRNYAQSWAQPITESEFRSRVAVSTVQFLP